MSAEAPLTEFATAVRTGLAETAESSQNERVPLGSTVVFCSDVDGTFSHHKTYSHQEADQAFALALSRQTPVVFVTSKTFAEMEVIEKEIGNWQNAPFIVENGGAIYVSKDYFPDAALQELPGSAQVIEIDGWIKIIFGKPYQELRKVLAEAAKELGLKVQGIGDMSAEEFAADCGLSVEAAANAKIREYQEGFKILGVPEEEMLAAQMALQIMIESKGYHMSVGGRYFQIMGSPAKVVAVEALLKLFEKKFGKIFSVGLGDAPADYEYMRCCDVGYVMANPHRVVSANENLGKLRRVDKEGPMGWSEVVTTLCEGKIL